MYAPNNKMSKYMGQKLIQTARQSGKSTLTLGDSEDIQQVVNPWGCSYIKQDHHLAGSDFHLIDWRSWKNELNIFLWNIINKLHSHKIKRKIKTVTGTRMSKYWSFLKRLINLINFCQEPVERKCKKSTNNQYQEWIGALLQILWTIN